MKRLLSLGSLLLGLTACPTAETDGGLSYPDASLPDSGRMALVLSARSLDLGRVVLGTRREQSFTVTNPNPSSLEVVVSAPAGADAASFSRTLNLPDQGGRFTLQAFGVVTVSVLVEAAREGTLAARLTVDACAGTCPEEVSLAALGVRSGLVCTSTVDVGAVNLGSCRPGTARCENQGNATERVTAAELEPTSDPAFTLEPPALPLDVAPGQAASFVVNLCPTQGGDVRGALLVGTFMPFETEHRVGLIGSGGGADVECTPAALEFGLVGVGAPAELTLRCENRGLAEAAVSGVVSGAGFRLSSAPTGRIAPGTTGLFVVEALASAAGALSGELTLTTNDPDDPTLRVPLSATGVELLPCSAEVSPGRVDFGLVAIGDRRTARLTLRNAGANLCIVRSASLAPGGSAEFSASGGAGPLAPGEVRLLQVALEPSANAVLSGELVVSFANPSTTDLTVALAGSAGSAAVHLSPSFLDFGQVPSGCASPVWRQLELTWALPGPGSVTALRLTGTSSGSFQLRSGVPVALSVGERTVIEVGFQPRGAGVESAELRIFAAGQTTPLIVPLAGVGGGAAARSLDHSFAPPVVDLLFVLEDSGAAGRMLDALIQETPALAAELGARGGDFHLGVITGDMESPARAGRLFGTPAFATAQTAALATDLEQRLAVGDQGSNQPQPLAALEAALGPALATGENAGFRRAGARLAVVFVAAADDESEASPGVGARVRALRGLAGDDLALFGVVPPGATDCQGPYGGGQAAPRLNEAIARAGGRSSSYCAPLATSLGQVLDEILGAPRVRLPEAPRYSTLAVSVGGQTVPEGSMGWRYEAASQSVVFVERSLLAGGPTANIRYEIACASASCGDDNPGPGEDCDDGNTQDGDGCSALCFTERCGDGVAQGAEQCDDGNLEQQDACLLSCAAARCGDSVLYPAVEECDDGNTTGGDGCPASCRFYVQTPLANAPFVPLPDPVTLVFSGGNDPNDDGTAGVSLPFPVRFYDVESSSITVSVNGLLAFGPLDIGASFDNRSFPEPAAPNAIVAGWWDDLYLDDNIPGARIAYQTLGAAPDRTFVVEWLNIRRVDHRTNAHRRFSFQIAFDEATHTIGLRYGDSATTGNPPTAATASAGIEDHGGTRGLEALGCSPTCNGRPRPMQANGFPAQMELRFQP